MPQFDLYAGVGAGAGYVVDVQADLLEQLLTHVVVPLLPQAGIATIQDLNPTFEIEGETYVLLTQELAAVTRSELRMKIGSLVVHRDEIRRALDTLFVGF